MASQPLLLIALIIFTLTIQRTDCFFEKSSCPQLQNYTVSASSGHDTPECASGHSNVSCETLEYLFTQVQSCANVTILDHLTLSGTLELSYLTNVTITGNTASLINVSCEEGAGIALQNPQRVKFKGLQFTACSLKCPNANMGTLIYSAALCIYQGNNIAITGCSFLDSAASGVIMRDVVGTNHMVDTNFTRNGLLSANLGSLVINRQKAGEATYNVSNCHFTRDGNHNSSDVGSSGLHLEIVANSSVFLNRTSFTGLVASQGSGVYINQGGNSSLIIEIHDSIFQSNHADRGGGGIWLTQYAKSPCACKLIITNSIFRNNSGKLGPGGGLAVYSKNLNGIIVIEASKTNWTLNNAKKGYAVAIYFQVQSDSSSSYTLPNNASSFNLIATFKECNFLNNTEEWYGIDLNSIGAVQLRRSKAEFADCGFFHNAETALSVLQFSYASFAGNTTFNYNNGFRGGALYVDSLSAIGLREGVFLNFEYNYAIIEGAAIYTEPTDIALFQPDDTCVFESISALLSSLQTYRVHFANNTAGSDAQSIFVGSSEACVNKSGSILLFNDKIFTYVPSVKSQVASFANSIALDYSPKEKRNVLTVMLGQYFNLVPDVTDIFNNSASTLFGNLELVTYSASKKITRLEDLKLIGPKMINIDSHTKEDPLYIKGNRSYTKNHNLYLSFIFKRQGSQDYEYRDLQVKLVDCRSGYRYGNESVCECINATNLRCLPKSSGYACVRYGYWFGDYNQTDGVALPCSGERCHFADGNCPKKSTRCYKFPDFCRLNDTDDFCWDGRSGIMCSSCRENYSFTYSAVKCVHNSKCTTTNTALLILGIVVYWIVIILFLFVILNLDLSIGLGFMYGIVYYFSVLNLFTDVTITSSVLTTIINTCAAVAQLCPRFFGNISVCFFESWKLNLHHSMFHYATPVFVITTIVVIILISRYCECRCPKVLSLAQNSPVHAICVLILFSYSSLTYTSFEILKFITIKGELRVHIDPEIPYFGPKHLPYAIVALVLECFILLPICFLLLFAPCLVRKVNIVKLRLKPILDDFQACYKPEYHWFAGFYFLTRQVLFLANAIPQGNLPQDNHAFQFINTLVLLIHSSLQPYRVKWLNILDTLLLFDVFFLSVVKVTWQSSNIVVLYLLILPPVFYLAIATILITCRRVFKGVCGRLMSAPNAPVSLKDKKDAFGDEANNKVFRSGSDFFRDCGEREPLLAYSKQPLSPGIEAERAKAFTTSSVRVSALKQFPFPQPNIQ